jgi:hypothetical protein
MSINTISIQEPVTTPEEFVLRHGRSPVASAGPARIAQAILTARIFSSVDDPTGSLADGVAMAASL